MRLPAVIGILWSLKLPIPQDGLNVDVTGDDLEIRRPKPKRR